MKQSGRRALTVHFAGERPGQLGPVDRVDRVGDRHRLAGLVGLQRTDVVESRAGPVGAERTPFLCRLLHPVLAESHMAGGERGKNQARGVSLGDGDQRNFGRIASCVARCSLDLGTDGGQIGGDIDGRRAVSAGGWGCVDHGTLSRASDGNASRGGGTPQTRDRQRLAGARAHDRRRALGRSAADCLRAAAGERRHPPSLPGAGARDARPQPRHHCAPAGPRPAGGGRPGARAARRRSRRPSAGARHRARRRRPLAS